MSPCRSANRLLQSLRSRCLRLVVQQMHVAWNQVTAASVAAVFMKPTFDMLCFANKFAPVIVLTMS